MKGKQKMVMQGMLQLLKSLLSPLHSPLLPSFLADSQASLCRSSVFADFLFFTWPTMGCIFLMWCIFVNPCYQGHFLSSLVLFWLSSWEHFVQDFLNICWLMWGRIIIIFFFLKLDVLKQVHVRPNCWAAFKVVWKWRNGYLSAVKGQRIKEHSIPIIK